MKTHSFVTISLICCAFFQQSAAAGTNDCENPRLHYLYWVQEYFDLADAIFFGTVIAEETPERRIKSVADPATPADASSMAELLEMIEARQSFTPQQDRLQSAIIEIEKSWKGPKEPIIDIKARLYLDDTGHHAQLKAGDSYLIFAFKIDDEEALYVPVGCTSHELVKQTASKIRVLDALTKKPGDR